MAGVPSLQAYCLDFLSEGMRGAEHHEMRTTFLRHLCDNAEKAEVLETFIHDFLQQAMYDGRHAIVRKTVAERLAALEMIERFLHRHRDLSNLRVRSNTLSMPERRQDSYNAYNAATFGPFARMELLRHHGSVLLHRHSFWFQLVDLALTRTRELKRSAPDPWGKRDEVRHVYSNRRHVSSQFR